MERVVAGRNQRFALGDAAHLPVGLTTGQRDAAHAILDSQDFVSVLIGDAGTGKTTVLTAIEGAHLALGGRRFMPLSPTTWARDAMVGSGLEGADTLQRFPASETMHAKAAGRVVLIDEAGLLSTQQLDHLTKIGVNSTFGDCSLVVARPPRHFCCRNGFRRIYRIWCR